MAWCDMARDGTGWDGMDPCREQGGPLAGPPLQEQHVLNHVAAAAAAAAAASLVCVRAPGR